MSARHKMENLNSGVVRILSRAVGLIGNDLVVSLVIWVLQIKLDSVCAGLDSVGSLSEEVLIGSSGNADLEAD